MFTVSFLYGLGFTFSRLSGSIGLVFVDVRFKVVVGSVFFFGVSGVVGSGPGDHAGGGSLGGGAGEAT